jgi:hypothetical protein
VVPDQHAAFGITRATQAKREISWKDLGLDELIRKGPGNVAGMGTGAGTVVGMGMGGYGGGWKWRRDGLGGGLPR